MRVRVFASAQMTEGNHGQEAGFNFTTAAVYDYQTMIFIK